ncbi:MAG: hypothetical protein KO464_09910, partial [Candidatus Methanofastidiosum sp.]|nr:hypothetical protein [Methanofastidiosum sp.]
MYRIIDLAGNQTVEIKFTDVASSQPGEKVDLDCGSTYEGRIKVIEDAIKDNGIEKIEECAKEWPNDYNLLYLSGLTSINKDIAEA